VIPVILLFVTKYCVRGIIGLRLVDLRMVVLHHYSASAYVKRPPAPPASPAAGVELGLRVRVGVSWFRVMVSVRFRVATKSSNASLFLMAFVNFNLNQLL